MQSVETNNKNGMSWRHNGHQQYDLPGLVNVDKKLWKLTMLLTEGSLEVKLPTVWTVEKQR